VQRALEESGPLGHARHFVIEDQRRRPLDALRFPWIAAQVSGTPAWRLRSAGLRAVDAPQ